MITHLLKLHQNIKKFNAISLVRLGVDDIYVTTENAFVKLFLNSAHAYI